MKFFKGRYTAKRKKQNRFKEWWGERRRPMRIAMIGGASLMALSLVLIVFVKTFYPEFWDVLFRRRLPDDDTRDRISINTPPLPSGGQPGPDEPGGTEGQEYTEQDDVYTFLLVGIHEGMTDTLMVGTLNISQGTCHILSIPRDTVIERAPRSVKKINGAYSQRSNTWDDEPGIAQLRKEIATLIGYQPEYYAMVDYKGFVRLIDAIDGVEFDVPMRMHVPSEGINLQKGIQTLNGNQAMQLVRFRYDHVTGRGYDDYGRMEIQQKLLAEAGKKALSNWTKIFDYIDNARENLTSNVEDWGILAGFAEEIRKIGMENVVFHTLPTHTVMNPKEIDYMYYEMVDAEEALALINETINPFSTPIGPELVEYAILTETR